MILLGGIPLENDCVIGQCDIGDLTTLEVTARMLGGKYEREKTWVEACSKSYETSRATLYKNKPTLVYTEKE